MSPLPALPLNLPASLQLKAQKMSMPTPNTEPMTMPAMAPALRPSEAGAGSARSVAVAFGSSMYSVMSSHVMLTRAA